jgi:hypothetical protein
MDLDFDGPAARGLRHYVRLVAGELGLTGESWTVHLEVPASAYIALDRRLPEFPERDTALLWHEHHGWALALENGGGRDLDVVTYVGAEVLPPPGVVGQAVTGLFTNGLGPRRVEPPRLRDPLGGDDDLALLLSRYAVPEIRGTV